MSTIGNMCPVRPCFKRRQSLGQNQLLHLGEESEALDMSQKSGRDSLWGNWYPKVCNPVIKNVVESVKKPEHPKDAVKPWIIRPFLVASGVQDPGDSLDVLRRFALPRGREIFIQVLQLG